MARFEHITKRFAVATLIACTVPVAALAMCVPQLGTRQQSVWYGHGKPAGGSWTEGLICAKQGQIAKNQCFFCFRGVLFQWIARNPPYWVVYNVKYNPYSTSYTVGCQNRRDPTVNVDWDVLPLGQYRWSVEVYPCGCSDGCTAQDFDTDFTVSD
jgi:hypothetical protein